VKDIFPGISNDNVPYNFALSRGGLLFTANDGVHGEEIWRSNGTETGTYMVQDIEAGSGGSNPQNIIESNGMTYLVITTDELGDELFAGISTVVLPVSELTFNGTRKDADALLTWNTREELNTAYFEVERSINGQSFSNVGKVAAAGTGGIHRYEFTDYGIINLNVPVVYYRLKQVDKDSRFAQSRTIALNTGEKNTILFYPNPVHDETVLLISSEKPYRLQARIVDNAGRVIKRQQWDIRTGNNTLNVDVSSLASGTYYLELRGEMINERKKFVKK